MSSTTPPNSQTDKTDEEITVQNFLYAITSNLWVTYNGPIQFKLAHGTSLTMAEINSLDSALTSFFGYLTGSTPTTDQLSAIRTEVMAQATAIVYSGVIPSS